METSLMASAPSRSRTHPNLPRRITHPDIPKGKEQVTMLCQRLLQTIISAPPSLPRRGGTVTIAIDKSLIIKRLLTIILLARISVPPLRGRPGGG